MKGQPDADAEPGRPNGAEGSGDNGSDPVGADDESRRDLSLARWSAQRDPTGTHAENRRRLADRRPGRPGELEESAVEGRAVKGDGRCQQRSVVSVGQSEAGSLGSLHAHRRDRPGQHAEDRILQP